MKKQSLDPSKLVSIMPDLKQIKLTDASLSDFTVAMREAEDSLENSFAHAYFENQKYQSITDSYCPYDHNKIQYIFYDFISKQGLEVTSECQVSYSGVYPAIKKPVEFKRGEFFQAHENVTITLQGSDENDKVLITLYQDHTGDYKYIVKYVLDKRSLFLTDLFKYAQENNFYKNQKISINLKFLDLDDTSWDDVILSDKKKKAIKESTIDLFDNIEMFKKFKISVQRGLILYGPPGTGKTQICKTLSNEMNCSVLYALPQDFHDTRIGPRNICRMAKDLAPCLLVIEDIDWIAFDREAGKAGFIAELMNQMDGIENFGDIITVGTTNRKDDLEEAIKNRPGRFDRVIEIGNPEQDQISEMIRLFTKEYNTDQLDIEKISSGLSDLSGSHVYEFCKTAAIQAIYENSIKNDELILLNSHFKTAWESVKNKDMASYAEMQSKASGGFGFGGARSIPDAWDDF